MRQTQTRLWWMEVLRGIMTITFGVLFIVIPIHYFIYALGVYLVGDGTLDIYKVATGKRSSNRKVLSYLGGAICIVLGLIGFISHILTIFLMLFIIAIRIIMSAVRAIIHALRSKSPYAGVIWLYGGLLVLAGLVIFLFPVHTLFFSLIFLFAFIVIYAFCDGFYLVGRGLLLRFASTVFSRSTPHVSAHQLEIPDNLPSTTRRAVVFVRRLGATGLGHIAWAFEWHNGWFNTGSVENKKNMPFVKPEEMGFWSAHTLDPIATMLNQNSLYDEYKLFFVTHPRPKDAWRTAIWESRQPYSAVRHNCNDVAYDILRAYGAIELLEPAEEHVPNDWFDALPGRSYPVAENPVIPVQLHKMSQRELRTWEILLTIPAHIQGTPPPWQQHGWRAMHELTLTWDKMLKDMSILFTSLGRRMVKGQVS